MRAILFGAGGQLGIDLERECRTRGHSVLALRRNQLDIAEEESVRREISTREPDWVINAAAYNRVDDAEDDPEAAMRVNGLAVRAIAMACREAGATLLQFSTDYVFAGDKGAAYDEQDSPGPRSAYGVSKLAGELFARSCCGSHYVLRVAGVYGPPGRYTNRGNFAEFVLRKCAEGSSVKVVADHIASPTYGPALAARSLDILERRIPFGLYHLAGGQAISWFDFAMSVARAAGCPARISPTDRFEYRPPAARPLFSALSNAKVEAAGIERMPGIEESLRDYIARRERERPQR